MRKLVFTLVIGVIALAFTGLLAPEMLPGGNPIHEFGDALRDIVGAIGDSIGFSARGIGG